MTTPAVPKAEYLKTIRAVEECIAEGFVMGGQPSAIYAASRKLDMAPGTIHARLLTAQRLYGLSVRTDIALKNKPDKPKHIIALDIETFPMEFVGWRTGKQVVDIGQVVEPTTIACASWQDISRDKITTVSVLDDAEAFKANPRNDRIVVHALHKLLTDAATNGDVMLWQNGDKFDLQIIRGRIVFYQLAPLPPIQTIDTLKASRQSGRQDSHKLDYKDKFLGGGPGKVQHRGLAIWREASCLKYSHAMRVKAMREMIVYNRGDLRPAIEDYRRHLPYMTTGPNKAIGVGGCCSRCGSKAIQHICYHDRLTRRYPVYRCTNCTGVLVGTQSIARAFFKAA